MQAAEFAGVNNVADPTRLAAGEFSAATNVDVGSRGNLLRRRGRTLLRAGRAAAPFVCPFGTLVLLDGDLVLLDRAGSLARVVYPQLGFARVWYALLPDGRVGFTNGLISGLASSTETTSWGISPPQDPGVGLPGDVPYFVTYRRLADGLESAPTYGAPTDPNEAIIGLPVRAGYEIRVYFAPNGNAFFLAGSTTTDTFGGGAASGPAYGERGLGTPPVGDFVHTWRSRVLIAAGNVLWATKAFQPELCDLTKDFVQFPEPITALYGTPDGVFVGTTAEMYFLAGTAWHDVKPVAVAHGATAKGSAVEVDLAHVKDAPKGVAQGALAIVGGTIYLLYGAGQAVGLTAGRYRYDASEVYATARFRDGVLQYVAAPV